MTLSSCGFAPAPAPHRRPCGRPCESYRSNYPSGSERVPGRRRREFEIADIGAETNSDPGADRDYDDIVHRQRRHSQAADEIGRAVDAGKTLVDRIGGRQVVDQHHRARAFAAEVEAERRPLPKDPEVAGVLGVEDAFAVTQSGDHGAAGFLSQHVAVGESKLAPRLLHDLREPPRNGAEETVTGIDDFVRGILRALRSGAARRRRRIGLSWRRRRIGLGRRWIGLGRQRRASQAEHDQNESDGSRHGAHRVLHGQQEVNFAYTRHGHIYLYLDFAAKPQPNRPMTGKTMTARRRQRKVWLYSRSVWGAAMGAAHRRKASLICT